MKIVESIVALQAQLEKQGFESFNLNIGLEEFIENVTSTLGSSNVNNPKFKTFKWVTEKEKDIEIQIAVVSSEIEDGDYEESYLIRSGGR